jgi:hypothetical protein
MLTALRISLGFAALGQSVVNPTIYYAEVYGKYGDTYGVLYAITDSTIQLVSDQPRSIRRLRKNRIEYIDHVRLDNVLKIIVQTNRPYLRDNVTGFFRVGTNNGVGGAIFGLFRLGIKMLVNVRQVFTINGNLNAFPETRRKLNQCSYVGQLSSFSDDFVADSAAVNDQH